LVSCHAIFGDRVEAVEFSSGRLEKKGLVRAEPAKELKMNMKLEVLHPNLS
jgi:hypothetical protein